MRPGVLAGIGGFGALFEVPKTYREPVWFPHGRRRHQLKLAFELQRHDTIGIDLVAMSVNDILTLAPSRFSSSTTTPAASSTWRAQRRW